jgi:hypothetical protein
MSPLWGRARRADHCMSLSRSISIRGESRAFKRELIAAFSLLHRLRNRETHLTSLPEGAVLIRSASSGDDAVYDVDRFSRRGSEPRRTQLGISPQATTPNRADQPLNFSANTPARILLVNGALALSESYLFSLRSIPAIVETLGSCADMYLHKGQGYALVILVLHCKPSETTEAAHFVRHRWSAARILLLESESAMIDDWLYDERVDPHSHPAKLCEAAIQLMAKGKWLNRA